MFLILKLGIIPFAPGRMLFCEMWELPDVGVLVYRIGIAAATSPIFIQRRLWRRTTELKVPGAAPGEAPGIWASASHLLVLHWDRGMEARQVC